MEDFAIYKDEDRQLYLSYWFERLSRHLLHLPLIPPDRWFAEKGTLHYDVATDYLRAFIEVKGTSNTDQLKLFDDQLDEQLGELGFPVEDGYVWIFAYRNRSNSGTRQRLLKRGSGTSWESLSDFLAEHISFAYLVDVRLLSRLREQNGIRPYTRDKFNLRCVLRLNRNGLKKIARNARENLVKLGIPEHDIARWLPPRAKRFLPRSIETVFDGRRVAFHLTIITPNGFKNRFLRRLNGTVKRNASQ